MKRPAPSSNVEAPDRHSAREDNLDMDPNRALRVRPQGTKATKVDIMATKLRESALLKYAAATNSIVAVTLWKAVRLKEQNLILLMTTPNMQGCSPTA